MLSLFSRRVNPPPAAPGAPPAPPIELPTSCPTRQSSVGYFTLAAMSGELLRSLPRFGAPLKQTTEVFVQELLGTYCLFFTMMVAGVGGSTHGTLTAATNVVGTLVAGYVTASTGGSILPLRVLTGAAAGVASDMAIRTVANCAKAFLFQPANAPAPNPLLHAPLGAPVPPPLMAVVVQPVPAENGGAGNPLEEPLLANHALGM